MRIPAQVEYIISALEQSGYGAYAVGGCVRDSLLGREPVDWDICSSALPWQVRECFRDDKLIETGLKHGTVTLMLDGRPFEITAYRVDGVYSDNRRPDEVTFTGSLRDDLARRDFTVNAMAFNPRTGIADFFGGMDDLKSRLIRCAGDPDKRFNEDALRIMRALRFSAVLGFSIENGTADAILRNKHLLHNIAAERIAAELGKLITGVRASEVMYDFTPVIVEIIPGLGEMVGFAQNTKYHHLDVWRHTLLSVKNAPEDVILRLAMLLHDVGKPRRYSEQNGTGHFHGHAEVSAEMARKILTELKFDGRTVETVTRLIALHDTRLSPRPEDIRRRLNRYGEDTLRLLIEVKRADSAAKAPAFRRERLDALDKISAQLDRIIKERQCFSLSGLAVDGSDLIAAGMARGPEIGAALDRLLNMVIDGTAANDREELLRLVKRQ